MKKKQNTKIKLKGREEMINLHKKKLKTLDDCIETLEHSGLKVVDVNFNPDSSEFYDYDFEIIAESTFKGKTVQLFCDISYWDNSYEYVDWVSCDALGNENSSMGDLKDFEKITLLLVKNLKEQQKQGWKLVQRWTKEGKKTIKLPWWKYDEEEEFIMK